MKTAVSVSAANRPLKIVHGFPRRPDMTYPALCAAITDHLTMLKNRGFGGVVSNVDFHNYTQDATEWNLFAFLADECQRLDMRLWIYDEKGYPSGGAGGLTLQANPDLEATAVVMVKESIAPWEEKTLPLPHGHQHFLYAAVYACHPEGNPLPDADGRYRPLAEADCRLGTSPVTLKNPSDSPAILCAFVRKRLYEGTHCVHNVSESRRYVDVTNPDAIREFIRNTYEKYAAAVPEHMTAGAGRAIPQPAVPQPGKIEAFFTDEPSFMGCYINAGLWPDAVHDPYDKTIPLYPVLSYGRDVENAFRSRYGYDLLPEFVSLFLGDTDHARSVRLDYYTLLSDLYEQSFFAQLSDWCGRHEVSFSGHILLEDDIKYHTVFEGNYFSLLRHMHTPGIDMLQSLPPVVRRYAFTPKLVSSVAHAYGRPHVMSEVSAHAQGGMVSKEQMYASLCAQYALGVDTFTYYYSEDFMEERTYNRYNTALGRIDAVMAGQHISDVTVYYPIETFRMYHKPSDAQYGSYTPEEEACQAGVVGLMDALLDRQIDFDFADMDVLSRCRVENGCLVSPSGEISQALILPPMAYTPAMTGLLSRLRALGLPVLTVADPLFAPLPAACTYASPVALADGLDAARLAVRASVKEAGKEAAEKVATPGVLALSRDTVAGRACLLCNTNETAVTLTLTFSGFQSPVLYDPLADEAVSCAFLPVQGGYTATVSLAGCQSLIVREA
jgi:hypothetical protein